MKKIYTSILFFVGFSMTLAAQETTRYYRNNNIPTQSIDSATYYIKFTPTQNAFISFERYCLDNVLKEKGNVQSETTLIKEGKIITYYNNGTLRDETNYSGGLPNGIQTHYFPSGEINYKLINNSAGYGFTHQKESSVKYLYCATPEGNVILQDGNGYFKSYNDELEVLQEGNVANTVATGVWKGYENNRLAFTEFYKNGEMLKGENFATDGNVYAYEQRNKRPEPKGGINNFYNYISASMQDANVNDAKVMMKFIVDSSGKLKNIEILNSSNSKVNELAIQTIRNAPKWNPALDQGKPVQVAYFMPITIKN